MICNFCSRSLAPATVNQGNHMCEVFWDYYAELRHSAASCALLIGGVHNLSEHQLQSFVAQLSGDGPTPSTVRRVQHGPSQGTTHFNGLFVLTDEDSMAHALRLLSNFGVRLIPLGHAATWRCLHVQLVPSGLASLQWVGQAESVLLSQLHAPLPMASSAQAMANPHVGGNPHARGNPHVRGEPDGLANALAGLALQYGTHAQQQQLFQAGGPLQLDDTQGVVDVKPPPPNSTPGDWKCGRCTNINFVFRDRCNRCTCPRPRLGPSALYVDVFGQYASALNTTNQLVCPFTVMLSRLPPYVVEHQVVEVMELFGSLAADGIKLHRPAGKALKGRRLGTEFVNAFCRFVHPNSATAAKEKGSVLIAGQHAPISAAFVRGRNAHVKRLAEHSESLGIHQQFAMPPMAPHFNSAAQPPLPPPDGPSYMGKAENVSTAHHLEMPPLPPPTPTPLSNSSDSISTSASASVLPTTSEASAGGPMKSTHSSKFASSDRPKQPASPPASATAFSQDESDYYKELRGFDEFSDLPYSATLKDECVVCNALGLDGEPPTHALVPCGHLCVCFSCAKTCTRCPICRTPSSTAVKINKVLA